MPFTAFLPTSISGSLASQPDNSRSHPALACTSEQTNEVGMCWFHPGNRPIQFFSASRGPDASLVVGDIMKTVGPKRIPGDVLIVEDDPMIALDFEDRILGFGVETVRIAGSVAKALEMIAARPPDFALLDV